MPLKSNGKQVLCKIGQLSNVSASVEGLDWDATRDNGKRTLKQGVVSFRLHGPGLYGFNADSPQINIVAEERKHSSIPPSHSLLTLSPKQSLSDMENEAENEKNRTLRVWHIHD